LRILLVRLRQIGDVVFTTPAIRAIRDAHPDAHIAYVVEPAAAPVVHHNPHLTEVIVAPRGRGVAGLLADLRLGGRLRRARFDVVIDFHGGPRASLLTWLSRAPVRIGYTIAGRSWMYTRTVNRPRELRARHSVKNQWDLLEGLGIAAASSERYPVEMPADPSAVAAIDRRLALHGVPEDARLIVIHASAGNPFRRWPVESFASVAAQLVCAAPGYHVVFTSGPSEQDALARVIAAARTRLEDAARNRILDCGEFSLPELRALVERAVLYVGGDSGPMHVATTAAVPIVSLYGPTLPARSAPWRSAPSRAAAIEVSGLECRPCDQRACAPGDFRCLTRIEPQQVVDAAARLLAGTTKMGETPALREQG
jgi:lipopolysaccharide heptosyltransferase II